LNSPAKLLKFWNQLRPNKSPPFFLPYFNNTLTKYQGNKENFAYNNIQWYNDERIFQGGTMNGRG
jgi:hypothetical protein